MHEFHSLLLGFAIGDAFGAGVEFQDRRWIRQHVDFSELINMRHLLDEQQRASVFSVNYTPWQYTDDTSMPMPPIRIPKPGPPAYWWPGLPGGYWLEKAIRPN